MRWWKECHKQYAFFFIFILVSTQVFSQVNTLKKDTTFVSPFEKRNQFSGQVRYFFMATDNQSPFTDYHAHALGTQAKYEKSLGKHFRFGVGGSAVYNLSSSDLIKLDTLAKRPSRYEIGLFDLQYPKRTSIYRLEEFYLQYARKEGMIRLGNQLINTPFINPQDGRMRPNFVSGLYSRFSLTSTQIEGGWIGGVLPRSISDWHTVESSIGLYPQGVNADGTAGSYAGHLSSKGILLAGITRTFSPFIKATLWDQYVENVFNTSMFQLDTELKLKGWATILASIQFTHQVKTGDGSSERSKDYFTPAGPAQVISAMTAIKSERFDLSVNYTRIFKDCRYLMPREWGREPFFTFISRERNEGYGDVQALVLKASCNFRKVGLKTSLQAGHFNLPDVKDVASNKYGMPSYNQINLELRYIPQQASNVDIQFLYVYKDGTGSTYQNPVFVFNKVNLSLYNVVFNYNWKG